MAPRRAYSMLLLLGLAGCEALNPFALVSHGGSRARIVPVAASPSSPPWVVGLRPAHPTTEPSPQRRATASTYRREGAYVSVLTVGYPAIGMPTKMPFLEIDAAGKPILPAGRIAPVIDISDIRAALRGGFDL